MNSGNAAQLPKKPTELTAVSLDSTRPVADRMAAMDALIEQAPEAAKVVMLSVAERTGEPRQILEAAGIGLARIEHNSGVRVSEFDMRDVSEIAFGRLRRVETVRLSGGSSRL